MYEWVRIWRIIEWVNGGMMDEVGGWVGGGRLMDWQGL